MPTRTHAPDLNPDDIRRLSELLASRIPSEDGLRSDEGDDDLTFPTNCDFQEADELLWANAPVLVEFALQAIQAKDAEKTRS